MDCGWLWARAGGDRQVTSAKRAVTEVKTLVGIMAAEMVNRSKPHERKSRRDTQRLFFYNVPSCCATLVSI